MQSSISWLSGTLPKDSRNADVFTQREQFPLVKISILKASEELIKHISRRNSTIETFSLTTLLTVSARPVSTPAQHALVFNQESRLQHPKKSSVCGAQERAHVFYERLKEDAEDMLTFSYDCQKKPCAT